jgi:hypothetical protein
MKPSNLTVSTLTCCAFTLTLLLVIALVSRSQTGCPAQSISSAGWPRDSVVRFDISSLPPALQTQALNALNAWNTANTQNNSGVTFVAADTSHPAVLTFRVGVPDGGVAAGADIHNSTGSSSAETAEIIVNASDTNYFNPSVAGFNLAIFKAFLHEIGHTMGLGDVPVPNPSAPPQRCGDQTARQSIMNVMCGVNDSGANLPTSITPCDQGSVFQNSQYYREPCPTSECNEGSGTPADTCSYPGAGGCPPGYHAAAGCCQPDILSPIVIDTDGSGFHLTDAQDGVWFDFYGTGQPIKISWTTAGSTNAWLVLDRNVNGTIDNAAELFGNFTPQPFSANKNGFIALAEFDKSGAGGNEDGKIDSQDVIFNSLRLWTDANHNGISDPDELHTFAELGLATLSLDYREAKRTDRYGNEFRYRAKIKDVNGAQFGRWAWDVFLVTQ